MRTLLVALVLMLPSSALAETPRWVQITATVAGSLVGEVVGAPLGAIAYDAVDPYGLGAECAADPDPLACEGSTLHVLGVGGPPGAAVVGTLGAVAGHALAGGERSGEVAHSAPRP